MIVDDIEAVSSLEPQSKAGDPAREVRRGDGDVLTQRRSRKQDRDYV